MGQMMTDLYRVSFVIVIITHSCYSHLSKIVLIDIDRRIS